MPLIEKISEMKKQGMDDNQIIQNLQEQGISPREINEALDQTRVKSAVSEQSVSEMEPSVMPSPTNNIPIPTPTPEQTKTQLPPTQMRREIQPTPPQIQPIQPPTPTQMPAEIPTSEQPPEQFPPVPTQETTEETYGYPAYQEYPEYEYPAQPSDTGMITEIAEQIVNENLQKTEKQISEIKRFKTEAGGRINNINERLRRIEIIIDRLQTSIINKIGDYGKDVSDLKKEMQATQDSFSKILNPLTENIEELRKITKAGTKTHKETKAGTKAGKKRGRRKKDSFEKYLRK